jgi:hypothetical protein
MRKNNMLESKLDDVRNTAVNERIKNYENSKAFLRNTKINHDKNYNNRGDKIT